MAARTYLLGISARPENTMRIGSYRPGQTGVVIVTQPRPMYADQDRQTVKYFGPLIWNGLHCLLSIVLQEFLAVVNLRTNDRLRKTWLWFVFGKIGILLTVALCVLCPTGGSVKKRSRRPYEATNGFPKPHFWPANLSLFYVYFDNKLFIYVIIK